MDISVGPCKVTAGGWRVEAIDMDGDGSCEIALFMGPGAQERAVAHARAAYGEPDFPMVWVTGDAKRGEGGYWEMVGVFTSYDAAVKACANDQHFVGPARLNSNFGPDTVEWPGCHYPTVEGRTDAGPEPKQEEGEA